VFSGSTNTKQKSKPYETQNKIFRLQNKSLDKKSNGKAPALIYKVPARFGIRKQRSAGSLQALNKKSDEKKTNIFDLEDIENLRV